MSRANSHTAEDSLRPKSHLNLTMSRNPSNNSDLCHPIPVHASHTSSLLRQLDISTTVSRNQSRAPSTGAPSVAGIGVSVARPDHSEAKIVVCMVGLPARGKSYLSNKLTRYLKWLEYDVRVFNVGEYRRKLAQKAQANLDTPKAGLKHSADFFDVDNQSAYEQREKMSDHCLEQLIEWLKNGGNVGIHDATNSTKKRRARLAERVAKEKGLTILFLESICDDEQIIAANIAHKVAAGDPDYSGTSPENAEKDFRARIKNYEKAYETVSEEEEGHLPYIKIANVGESVTMNHLNSYLESRIGFYLMNLHIAPRTIYLSRHGESMHNVAGLIGGDSDLSPQGQIYAKALPQLIKDNVGETELTVWTSTLKRTNQTAAFLPYQKLSWRSLDELDAGVCDSMTYEEIAEAWPTDAEARDYDKYNYRYRGGEAYRDVTVRLEPVIMEMERQGDLLIIAHQAIIRCLYGYFHDLPKDELPYLKIPLHTLIKLTPKAFGCSEERYKLNIEAVDTHRPKPAKVRSLSSTPARMSISGMDNALTEEDLMAMSIAKRPVTGPALTHDVEPVLDDEKYKETPPATEIHTI